MLLLSLLNLIILIFLLIYDRSKTNDVFSIGSIFIYFSLLPALSNLYFSFSERSIFDDIFGIIDPVFRNMIYVYLAMTLYPLINMVAYMGIHLSRKKGGLTHLLIKKLFSVDRISSKSAWLLFISSLIVFIYFINMLGGLLNIWLNINLRSSMNSGLGYIQTYYMFGIHISSLILIYNYLKEKKYLRVVFLMILTTLVLGGLGARGPIIGFFISLMVLYNYKIRKIKSLFNKKTITILLFAPVLILGMLQFRDGSVELQNTNINLIFEEAKEDFEREFIARLGRLERDVVMLQYFENHSYWYGTSYLSLLYAPIPRSLLDFKPPNDTGMYLRSMAKNKTINPPMDAGSLDDSSWPEHNWAGFMNFGYAGLFILTLIASYLSGRFYYYLRYNGFPLSETVVFCYLMVNGLPVLSPAGIIRLLMTIVVYVLVKKLFFR